MIKLEKTQIEVDTLKKYILFAFPIFYYGASLSYSNGNIYIPLLNMISVLVALLLVLKQTELINLSDWIIGILVSLYMLALWDYTIRFDFHFTHVHYSPENLQYVTHFVNLVPFHGISDVLQHHPSALYQITGNTMMLAPLAFTMLYFKWTNRYKQTIWYCMLCTVGIECMQFVQSSFGSVFHIGMKRSSDIDDVLLNTLSAVIGVGAYVVWVKIMTFINYHPKKSNMTCS